MRNIISRLRHFLNPYLCTIICIIVTTFLIHSKIGTVAIHPNGAHPNKTRVLSDQDVVKHWTSIPTRSKRGLDFFGFEDFERESSKGLAKLEWKHCGNKNDAIILKNIHMEPNPIEIPGTVLISFEMDVKENQTAPIKLKVDMKKKIPMLFGIHTWIPVPCYENGLGSCVIEDICDTSKLNFGKCPKAFEEQDLTCKCPILKGTYTFPPIEQEVPEPPEDIDPILMDGEFKVKFSLFKGHKRLTCYETNAVINL